MKLNKEIPTAEELQAQRGHHFIMPRPYTDENVKALMIEFTKLHLSKQAEYIAEKADTKEISSGWDNYRVVDKQSILQASKEYINNLK